MKKNLLAFLFCVNCLAAFNISAQDNLLIKKNRVYIEVLGNNFIDPNTYSDVEFVSLNYSRKIISNKYYYMLSLGCAPFRGTRYVSVRNDHNFKATNFGFSAGVLAGRNVKRNGVLLGLFFTGAIGEFVYNIYIPGNHGAQAINYHHQFTFQISPSIAYQLQSKSENLFFRVSYAPKILPSLFSEKHSGGSDNKYVFPFWFGISIGGGW
jgi:hypothetical protein